MSYKLFGGDGERKFYEKWTESTSLKDLKSILKRKLEPWQKNHIQKLYDKKAAAEKAAAEKAAAEKAAAEKAAAEKAAAEKAAAEHNSPPPPPTLGNRAPPGHHDPTQTTNNPLNLPLHTDPNPSNFNNGIFTQGVPNKKKQEEAQEQEQFKADLGKTIIIIEEAIKGYNNNKDASKDIVKALEKKKYAKLFRENLAKAEQLYKKISNKLHIKNPSNTYSKDNKDLDKKIFTFQEKYISYGSEEYYEAKYLKYKEKYLQLKAMLQNQSA